MIDISIIILLAGGFLLRSAGWTLRWLIRRSEHAGMMMKFSWKSLASGARLRVNE